MGIVFCEHPHVYTLGRSGKEKNMLLSDEQLKAIDNVYHIDRGGDITYHGSRQLVCYPRAESDEFRMGLKEYVHFLEQAVINVLALLTASRQVDWIRRPEYGSMPRFLAREKFALSG